MCARESTKLLDFAAVLNTLHYWLLFERAVRDGEARAGREPCRHHAVQAARLLRAAVEAIAPVVAVLGGGEAVRGESGVLPAERLKVRRLAGDLVALRPAACEKKGSIVFGVTYGSTAAGWCFW